MTTATLERSTDSLNASESPEVRYAGKGRIYAIAFDLDTQILQENYGSDSYNNAYADIRKLLATKHHFKWQQGSVYFGDPNKVNAVTCVLAAMDVAQTFGWFAAAVRDVRMLRIEEDNDLMEAVTRAAGS
jgi:virulence-associated protein VapD